MESLDNTPIILTIKISQGQNFKGSKSSLNSFIRTQFADYDYKDVRLFLSKPQTPTVSDNLNPDYNFVFEQTFNNDEALIEIFANKTVTFVLHESLPKDKTAVLGTTEVSLYKNYLAFFKREDLEAPIPDCALSFNQKIPITYANTKMLAANQELPSIQVEFTLSKPLLSAAILASSVFLTVSLDDFRPVPDDWTLKDGNEKDLNSNMYNYYAALRLPTSTDEFRTLTISNGFLTTTEEQLEVDPCEIAPHGIPLITTEEGTAQKAIDHVASIPSDEVNNTEKDSQIVVKWNNSYIVWLSPAVLSKLRDEGSRKIEIEIYRLPQSKFSAVNDLNAHKYRGKTSVDLAIGLNPHIIGIKGRYNVECCEVQGECGAAANADHKTKKGGGVADIYKTLGTTLGLKFLFSHPLINKKKLQEMTKSVTDYIPKRPVASDKLSEKRSLKAAIEYKGKIKEIVNQLVGEYKEAMHLELDLMSSSKNELQTQTPADQDKRQKLFLFHLNKSGAYYNMKEQLKTSVVHIVRERFKKRSPFTGKAELQLFMSEVYVYLMDEMHIVLNELYRGKEKHKSEILETIEFDSLKKFADEAEWNRNSGIAAKYHQQRIAKFEDNFQSWFDYSAFCLRNQLSAIGIEGFREIISRNPKYVPSLIAHGMICLSAENYEESRTFLEQSLELDPDNIVALSTMGIFLESIGEDLEAEKYFVSAKSAATKQGLSPNYETAGFALLLNCGDIVDKALAQELVFNGPNCEPYLLLSRLEIQRENFSKAINYLNQALEISKTDPAVWEAIGHIHYIQNEYNNAKVAYETCLSFKDGAKYNFKANLVFLRLGHIYLKHANHINRVPDAAIVQLQNNLTTDDNLAMLAKTMYLNSCDIEATSQSWLGVGRACFALKEYDEAEDAFSEANIINNRDSEVWAHLALLCLRLEKVVEANQAVSQALRLGINDTEVLRLLGIAFLETKQQNAATELFRLAVESEPKSTELQSLFTLAVSQSKQEV